MSLFGVVKSSNETNFIVFFTREEIIITGREELQQRQWLTYQILKPISIVDSLTMFTAGAIWWLVVLSLRSRSWLSTAQWCIIICLYYMPWLISCSMWHRARLIRLVGIKLRWYGPFRTICSVRLKNSIAEKYQPASVRCCIAVFNCGSSFSPELVRSLSLFSVVRIPTEITTSVKVSLYNIC